MGGVIMMLAGAAVYYRTRLQPTVALSSTEAEFVNMTDAGKAALYLRWILEELNVIQTKPTPILADNAGAIALCNAQKPTRRTRHVEQKYFVVLQWTDEEYLKFVKTPSEQNYSDSLSKQTARSKFYEHTDIFMGKRQPAYTSIQTPIPSNKPSSEPKEKPRKEPTKEPRNEPDTRTRNNTIIHYMGFSTSKNVNKTDIITSNPIFDILEN